MNTMNGCVRPAAAIALALALAALSARPASAQDGATAAPAAGTATAAPATAVPREFRGIALGMGLDEVKALLDADGLFDWRGEPDVSLLPRPNETVIEVSGSGFVKRAFFQFHEGKLFVMIYLMNEDRIDHYSIFTSVSARYGKPAYLSPSESVWYDDATRMSIERPLAVKYVDRATFDALKAAGELEESWEDILRADFLDDF